jgi:hypothetical protein
MMTPSEQNGLRIFQLKFNYACCIPTPSVIFSAHWRHTAENTHVVLP